MEECEALCTRLAIMVNGQFKCMGSTQHIKTKYGDGYAVHIKTHPEVSEQTQEFFFQYYPTAEVLEELPTLLVFQVPLNDATLYRLFDVLESGKKNAVETGKGEQPLVDDYSISQTTLDQVFINFANDQNDDIIDVPKRKPKKPASKKRLRTYIPTSFASSSQYGELKTKSGKGVELNDALLDNMSLASQDSNPSSIVTLRNVSANSLSTLINYFEEQKQTSLEHMEVSAYLLLH